jgi:hypothetical protein
VVTWHDGTHWRVALDLSDLAQQQQQQQRPGASSSSKATSGGSTQQQQPGQSWALSDFTPLAPFRDERK